MTDKTEIVEAEGRAVTVQATQSDALMSALIEASRNPEVDIDKMERLMQMHKDIRDNDERKAFFADLAAAQAKMPAVTRDAHNNQTNSKYAKLESINKAIKPVITEHGFALSFGTDDCPIEGHFRVTCDMSHRDGFVKSYHADVPSDGVGIKGNANKTATHSFGSTMTYGRRYLTCMIFNIAIQDEDDDGQKAGKGDADITAGHHKMLIEKIDEVKEAVGFDEAAFLNAFNIGSTEEMTEFQFERAIALLNKKLTEANKGKAA